MAELDEVLNFCNRHRGLTDGFYAFLQNPHSRNDRDYAQRGGNLIAEFIDTCGWSEPVAALD
jgi:hypothetical protein